MHPLRTSIFSVFLFLIAAADAETAQWSQFRGPNGSGVADSFRPPLDFDATKPAWKTTIAPGHSSPVVWDDKLFVTAVDKNRLVTIALDCQSGEILWEKQTPETRLENIHEANSFASSTPCADEERVYAYFGSYGLLCYDHDGNLLWQRPIATPKSMYGMSTSPILYKNLLILVLDNDANLPNSQVSLSKIIALNRETGALVWEAPRPYNRSSWSTPIVWNNDQETVLAVIGNGRAYAYDPLSGAEKWYVNGFSRETIAVPIAGDGQVYFSASRQGGWGDSQLDPEPFWEAALAFDQDGDLRIGRDEITQHFTIPFRPELPPGHPGFGMPLPNDPDRRKERQQSLFNMRDRDKDGFWTKEEFVKDMSVGRGRPNLAAVESGGIGDVTQSHVAWNLRSGIPEIPSPIYYSKRIYLVRSGGILSCVNTDDGNVIYRERLGAMGQYRASPIIANGHLLVVSDRGVVSVLGTGDVFGIVHQVDLGEPVPATPAVDKNTLYIRTEDGIVAFR